MLLSFPLEIIEAVFEVLDFKDLLLLMEVTWSSLVIRLLIDCKRRSVKGLQGLWAIYRSMSRLQTQEGHQMPILSSVSTTSLFVPLRIPLRNAP
jgi:hypothetical protein